MKIFIMLIMLTMIGCTQGPNFNNPVTITSKESNSNGTFYFASGDEGVRGVSKVKFGAPNDFANVGDVIIFKDGSLTVKRKDQ